MFSSAVQTCTIVWPPTPLYDADRVHKNQVSWLASDTISLGVIKPLPLNPSNAEATLLQSTRAQIILKNI